MSFEKSCPWCSISRVSTCCNRVDSDAYRELIEPAFAHVHYLNYGGSAHFCFVRRLSIVEHPVRAGYEDSGQYRHNSKAGPPDGGYGQTNGIPAVRGGGRRAETAHRRVPLCGTGDRIWASASGDDYRPGPAMKDVSDHVEPDGGERTKDGGITLRRAQGHQIRVGTSCGAVRHVESSGRA